MILLWIVLGVIAYIAMGALIAGLIDDDDLDVACALAWPIVIIVVIFATLFSVIRDWTITIKDYIVDLFDREEKV